MKIGMQLASVSRQAGGLLGAVRPLALKLAEAGCNVTVLSGWDEATDVDLPGWQPLKPEILARLGPVAFGYLPALNARLRHRKCDLLHTHGLWVYPSIAARRWHCATNCPLVISPHGMLDPWALRNSAWKKRLAGWLYENDHLRSAACLHALCEAEFRAMRAYGLTNPVAIIPNGVELPAVGQTPRLPDWASELPASCRVLLFLGRIHPKKGLIPLLNAWATAISATPVASEPWRLVIAGWDQGGHQSELQGLAEALGVNDSVLFVGPQFGDQMAATLMRADAFVLPSFSEGLPMAVLEAWAYGLPVLMTPACNLPEGFASGAAIEMAPEPDSIAEALMRLFAMPEAERRAMGERGRRLVEQRFAWPNVAAQMLAVYRWVLGLAPRPECVIID